MKKESKSYDNKSHLKKHSLLFPKAAVAAAAAVLLPIWKKLKKFLSANKEQ